VSTTPTPTGACHLSYVTVTDPQATTSGGPHWSFSAATADPSVLVLAANGNGQLTGQPFVGTGQQPSPSDPFGGLFGGLFGGFFGSPGGSTSFPSNGFGTGVSGATATVTDQRATPHVLVLTANEPTTWSVTATAPTAITEIITLGSGVSVNGPAGVPVAHRDAAVSTSFSADLDRDPAATTIRNIVGQIHEAATADAFSTFTIAPAATQHCNTPTIEVAAGTPMTWNTNGTPGIAANNILTAPQQFSSSFMFSGSTLRDHGKFYFEAQILASSQRGETNIGVSNLPDLSNPDSVSDGCTFSPFGSGSCGFAPNQEVPALQYGAGSRIGFAVDLDDGAMFMQVNGQWMPAQPGAGGTGYPIARGTAMTPVANLSGGDQIQMATDPTSIHGAVPPGFTSGW
jgi:hypothetical protein